MSKKEVLEAIRCCRCDDCEKCPLQDEICDDLYVPTMEIPVGLVDRIEEELEDE